jgi:hypothetical protein
MGPRLSLSKAYTIPLQINLTAWVWPQCQSNSWSYFTTKINKKSKAVREKTGQQSQIQWCKLKVVTSKHEDFNLVFTNHGKEDGIYPLKRDSKAQNKDQRSIVTTCKNTYKGFAFWTYWEHNSAIYRWNLIILVSLQGRAISWYHCYLQHPNHSSLQETIKSVKYWKGKHIPPSKTNLADLAKNKEHSKNMILTYQSCS